MHKGWHKLGRRVEVGVIYLRGGADTGGMSWEVGLTRVVYLGGGANKGGISQGWG